MDKIIFENRSAAGLELAKKLKKFYKQSDVLVLALPRGGVPVAFEMAQTLELPLDVFLVRKIGIPWNPEVAMGAIAMGDVLILNEELIHFLKITEQQLNEAIIEEKKELLRRNILYRNDRPFPDVCHKTIILVDDGLATGATLQAAVQALKKMKAKHIVIAVPIGTKEAVEILKKQVDELICLNVPGFFHGVGGGYVSFPQTSDEEVIGLLTKARPATHKEDIENA